MARTLSAPNAISRATDRLNAALKPMRFGAPVTHVYNPLEYARASWDRYVERFAGSPRELIFLGMNPGPFGMAQTGVPFGEIEAVRGWMGIDEPVAQPRRAHPKRPVEGFACTRSEVSGRRLWGWAASRFGAPENFFRHAFVLNYCPLVFMEESGRNFTPDKLRVEERDRLFAACDEALLAALEALRPRWAIGVGGFAEERLRVVAGDRADLKIGRVLHPSPASPAANRGWAPAAERDLAALGVDLDGLRG